MARVTQHHDEGHQWPARVADVDLAKVRPVNLSLLPLEGAQPQIRFSARSWSIPGHSVAQVIRAAGVTAGAQHLIQTAGSQSRIALEGLLDESNIGVEHRGTHILRGYRDAGLREHTTHSLAVHV